MSTVIQLPEPALEPQIIEVPATPHAQEPKPARTASRKSTCFAEEQIRALVRKVFFPGWPKPIRHVVFSAVDERTYVAELCMDLGRALCAQVTSSVCVVEANSHHPELESVYWRNDRDLDVSQDEVDSLRNNFQPVCENLWLAPLRMLWDEDEEIPSVAAWGRRLSDLCLEFDYTILHGPPAGIYSEAPLLAHLSDGAILVVEANSTRRVAAERAKETLLAANARLLGTVLTEREFPVPERLYRRL